jgi:large subunit ribosomal protein L30
MAAKNIKVTLAKSLAGQLKNIQASVRGLGLRRRHQTVEIADTPQNRGMIGTASHLLKVQPPAEGGKK